VLVGYGIVARILKAVAAEARANGIKVGVLRPITLYPFRSRISTFGEKGARLRSGGDEQRPNGGRCAARGERRASGGVLQSRGRNVPSHEEILRIVQEQTRRNLSEMQLEEERMTNV